MTLAEISSNLLYVAFIAYLIATFVFGGAVKGNKEGSFKSEGRWGEYCFCDHSNRFPVAFGLFYHSMDGDRPSPSQQYV